jgi:hypothetical protein
LNPWLLIASVVASTALGTAACGGKDEGSSKGPEAAAGHPGTGGSGTPGSGEAGGPSSGNAGATSGDGGTDGGAGGTDGGAGGPGDVTSFVSNLPGLTVTRSAASQAGTEGLVLLSSNFQEDDVRFDNGDSYKEWFAVVKNTGTQLICYPQVTADFKDAEGATLLNLYGFADAAKYSSIGTLTMPCLRPGAEGVLWTNDISAPINVADISSVEIKLGALQDQQSQPHPDAPEVLSAAVTQGVGPGYWAVQGEVKAVNTIYNISMEVYPVVGGLVVDRLLDHHLDTLYADGTWSYETASFEGAKFTEMYQFIDFLSGAEEASISSGVTRTARVQAALEQDERAGGERAKLSREAEAYRESRERRAARQGALHAGSH